DYTALSYDLKRFTNGTIAAADDVVIVGANGSTLRWRSDFAPGSDWTAFNVKLTAATFGVTAAEFNAVMKNVSEVHIRGEFDTSKDIEGLDNVVVNAVAPPFAGRVTALPSYKLACRNATTGQNVTRGGQTSSDWNCEEQGLVVNDGDMVSVTI